MALHTMLNKGPLSILIFWFLFPALTCRAIINANSQTNTTPPANGAPWDHVGYLNGASGVYVGAGWVLTAYHVGPGNLSLDGVIYQYSGTSQRITNSDGSGTDLVMYKLDRTPNLSRLPLSSNTPTVGTAVDMIAWGRIAAGPETTINGSTGFPWTSYGHKSWGNNKVSGVLTRDFGMGSLATFYTDFSSSNASQTPGEAEAAQGDSGGGVFVLKNSIWYLAGVVDTITVKQPDAAIYGDLTFIADVNKYRGQISALMGSTIPSLTISRLGADLQVSWTDTGVNWTVQGSPTLTPGAWTDLNPALTIVNGQVCATIPSGNSARFFRLRKG